MLRAERQHVALRVAHEQRVLVLHDGDRRQRQRLGEIIGVDVGNADRSDQSVADKLLERAERVCERRRRVYFVDEVEVDSLDTQTLEALVNNTTKARGREARVVAARARDGTPCWSTPARPASAREAMRRSSVSLRPPPYDEAVSNRRTPPVHAASMSSNASTSRSPRPTSDRSDPIPPKLPQPRTIRSRAIKRSRCDMPARAACRSPRTRESPAHSPGRTNRQTFDTCLSSSRQRSRMPRCAYPRPRTDGSTHTCWICTVDGVHAEASALKRIVSPSSHTQERRSSIWLLRPPAEARRIALQRIGSDLLLVRRRACRQKPVEVGGRRLAQSGVSRLRRLADRVDGLPGPVVAWSAHPRR